MKCPNGFNAEAAIWLNGFVCGVALFAAGAFFVWASFVFNGF